MWFVKKMLFIAIILQFSIKSESKIMNEQENDIDAKIAIEAVFIECQHDEALRATTENEGMRFQRDKLFKHNALNNCDKKLALTVKMTSEPNESGNDEYIPIEHVIEGSAKRRVRLLNPYVLRLRREPVLQAYKIQRIDTVSGILSKTDDRIFEESDKNNKINGEHRNAGQYRADKSTVRSTAATVALDRKGSGKHSYLQLQESALPYNVAQEALGSKDYVKREICTIPKNTSKRGNRHEQNVVVEGTVSDEHSHWKAKLPKIINRSSAREQSMGYGTGNHLLSEDATRETDNYENSVYNNTEFLKGKSWLFDFPKSDLFKTYASKRQTINPNPDKVTFESDVSDVEIKGNKKLHGHYISEYHKNDIPLNKKDHINIRTSSEKEFALYEIGDPDLWSVIHVQLFEKMSTPERKTVWNDITKAKIASVSSRSPEWSNQDINVRYRSSEWLSRDDFTLPKMSLCLLEPMYNEHLNTFDNPTTVLNGETGEYIVLPLEDVVTIDSDNVGVDKRDENYSNTGSENGQGHRKVVVRLLRALGDDIINCLNIASQGSAQYLTLPHRRAHRAQIDIEARADENQLVRVGLSGRISSVVADTSRPTRTILTLQVTNTGLAAARFRVLARDCDPEISSQLDDINGEELTAGPALLPPRHTQRFRLEIPIEMPVDVAHCSVALTNSADEAVAMRDVRIKKGDRCFCVWHCDCVCMSDDPKLLCREMSDIRQRAAGLGTNDRSRHARSVCYSDNSTVNVSVVVIGVLMILLIIGLMKASLGLVLHCVGAWGLDRILITPRKLDHYYESSLFGRPVEYDEEGWPVHPDTKERTVRLISKLMEFTLNIIFFVVMPCLVFRDAVKEITSLCHNALKKCDSKIKNTKACYSSHDIQGMERRWRRRGGRLRQWMTPHAEHLSADLWQKGLDPEPRICEMRPLLREDYCREYREAPSCADSEQDDTEYVLMQMQKSRESLAKSQRKPTDPGSSSKRKKKMQM